MSTDTKYKFKKGDRVRVTSATLYAPEILGQTGTIDEDESTVPFVITDEGERLAIWAHKMELITAKPDTSPLIQSTGYAPDVLEWTFGQEVFLKCDADQKRGMVTGIVMRPTGVGYYVSWGDKTEVFHYVFELTISKDFSA